MTTTTPREALEKAYYDAIGPAFGPPEQLTEEYSRRHEARRVKQAKSLTDTALTALAPWLRTPGTVESCKLCGGDVARLSSFFKEKCRGNIKSDNYTTNCPLKVTK